MLLHQATRIAFFCGNSLLDRLTGDQCLLDMSSLWRPLLRFLLPLYLTSERAILCGKLSDLQAGEHRGHRPLPRGHIAVERATSPALKLLPLALAHVDGQLLPSSYLVFVLRLHEPDPLHDLTTCPHERGRYRYPMGRLLSHLLLLCTHGERPERIQGVATLSAGVESIIVRGHSYYSG